MILFIITGEAFAQSAKWKMEEKTKHEKTIKTGWINLGKMDLEQRIRAEKIYHELGLDPIVNKVLKDFPSSLSGIDRVLDKIFGPYDIKGRAKAVAGISALMTHAGLDEEHKKEVAKLREQIHSLEEERDRLRTNYGYLVQKAADLFKGDYKNLEELESENKALTADLERLKSNYEGLGIAITTLAGTIPYDEIREKSGQALYTTLLEEPIVRDMLKDSAGESTDIQKYLGMAAEKGAEEAGRHAIEILYKVMKDRIDKIRIEVTLYTQTEVLKGAMYHLVGERLSDLLNDISDRGSWIGSPYIQLYNVNVKKTDGRDEVLPTAHIKKSAVNMVLLADPDAARGVGAKDSPKSFPFVSKLPVNVELHAADYVLIGNIHCDQGQKPQDVIAERLRFLPITDVSIRPPGNKTIFIAPFVALNKEQILPLKREEIPLESLESSKEYYRKLIESRLGYLN